MSLLEPTAVPPEPRASAPETGGWVYVRFKGRRVDGFVNPRRLPLARGDAVMVEVERGEDLGEVFACGAADIRRHTDRPPRRILRRAEPDDLARLAAVRAEDARSLRVVKERVRRFDLPMHLVDAEHQFDGNRVTFYFTADHRIDFRELVRDLASIFRTRIELRQIGSREAARRLGGFGPCGLEACCASFLVDFERVTLQMARDQHLVVNPTRLSGLCGRLLCCLAFEGGCGACGGGRESGCSGREGGCSDREGGCSDREEGCSDREDGRSDREDGCAEDPA